MKNLVYLLLLSAAAASAQTAVWPGAVVTDSQLLVAANFCGSRLSAEVTDTVSTTIFVTNASVSPTCFLVNQEVQVDNEMMKITGVGFGQLTVVRGFDNSTASTHHNNAPINNVPAAWYHNATAKEVESIEAWLAAGGGGGGSFPPGGTNRTIQYNNNGAFGGITTFAYASLFPDFPTACTSTVTNGGTLFVDKAETGLATGTYACDLSFITGGSLQPAASQVLTLTGAISAPLETIFDVSLGGVGSIIIGSTKVAGVYPQWFGAVAGSGMSTGVQTSNYNAFNAAQYAAAPNDIPILINARFENYNYLNVISDTTWRGVGQGAEVVGNLSSEQPYGTFSLCTGVYTEQPSKVPCNGGFVDATYVRGFLPANRGSATLTAFPSGGFNAFTIGSWIMVVEGNSPKWDTFVSWHRIANLSGDTLTLDRPLEFDFNGSTGTSTTGVIEITPVQNVTFDNLSIVLGSGSNMPYSIVGGPAENVTVKNCRFHSEATSAGTSGFLFASSDVNSNMDYNVTLTNNVFYDGIITGFNFSSYVVESGNIFDAIGTASSDSTVGTEVGQGSNHIIISNNQWSGQPAKTNGLIAGTCFYCTVTGNIIQHNSTATGAAISLTGFGIQIFNNSIIDSTGGIGISATAPTNDVLRAHDITISNNYVESRGSANCFVPPVGAMNIIVTGNTFNCTNPVTLSGGPNGYDPTGLVYYGNTEVLQQGVTPTMGLTGYTASGSTSGGPYATNLKSGLTSIPMFAGGFLRVWNTLPGFGSTTQTTNANDMVIANTNTSGIPGDLMWLTTAAGTYAATPLSGVTASTTSGSNVVTISGTVAPRTYITIVGVTGTKRLVWQINSTTWQMDSTASATVSGAAVAYAAPTFLKVPITQTGSCVLTGTGPFTCTSSLAIHYTQIPVCYGFNNNTPTNTLAVQGTFTTAVVTQTGSGAAGQTVYWGCASTN